MAHVAGAATCRLAIIADKTQAELASLLTAELAKDENLELVERDDIERLATEQALNNLKNDASYRSTGQILKADGLLILSTEKAGDKVLHFARAVAVDPGVVMDQMPLAEPEQMREEQVKVIVQRFSALFPKLKAVAANQAARISFHGLRFTLDSAQANETERALNALLANRLAHEKDVLVLERWKMELLGWEQSLNAEPANTFWAGSYLLDGHITQTGDKLQVDVRLRPPSGNEPLTIHFSGRKDELRQLADQLGALIKEHLGKVTQPLPWDPVAEGESYARVADWALQSWLVRDGIEASETAIALGFRKPWAEVLRIKAYAMRAYLEDLNVQGSDVDLDQFDKDNILSRIESVEHALRLVRDYAARHSAMKKPPGWNLEYPPTLARRIISTGLKVLKAGYFKNLCDVYPMEFAALREEVRSCGAVALRGQVQPDDLVLPIDEGDFVLTAPLWSDTPEQTLKTYCAALRLRSDLNQNAGMAETLRREWSRSFRSPKLDTNSQGGSSIPWLIDWRSADQKRAQTSWQQFVDALLQSLDTQEQADGLMFKYHSLQSVSSRRTMLPGICQFLWAHRDEVNYGPHGLVIVGFRTALDDAATDEQVPAEIRSFRVRLFAYLLEKGAMMDVLTLWMFDPRWDKKKPEISEKDAAMLFGALTHYLGRAATLPGFRAEFRATLSDTRNFLQSKYPALEERSGTDQGIAVTKFWNPNLHMDVSSVIEDGHVEIDAGTLTSAEGKVWFANGTDRVVYCVDPITFQTQTWSWPKDPVTAVGMEARAWSLDVTQDYLFLASGSGVRKYDRLRAVWTALDLPPSSYAGTLAGNSLYLCYPMRPSRMHGLIKVNPADGSTEAVISSRRTPPLHFLDGKPDNEPLAIFAGLDDRMNFAVCDVRERGERRPNYSEQHVYVEGDGGWRKAFTSNRRLQVRATDSGAIVVTEGVGDTSMSFANFEQIVYFSRKAHEPELLLQNPTAKDHPVKSEPQWNFPPDLCRQAPGDNREFAMAMDGERLWILSFNRKGGLEGSDYLLYRFDPSAKEAVKVPLHFQLSDTDRKTLPRNVQAAGQLYRVTSPSIPFHGLQPTPHGLVILGNAMPGFWFIPKDQLKDQITKAGRAIQAAR